MSRFNILFLVYLFSASKPVVGQDNSRAVIIANISGYTGNILESNVREWQGEDTLVPFSVLRPDGKMGQGRNTFMGVRYLVESFYPQADENSPNAEAISGYRRKMWRSVAQINGKEYKWTFNLNKPRLISNEFLLGGTYMVCPGDSIYINYEGDRIQFSGKGSARFQALFNVNRQQRMFNMRMRIPRTLQDYLDYNEKWIHTQSEALKLLDSYRTDLSDFDYDWVKAKILSVSEGVRTMLLVALPLPIIGNKAKDLQYSLTDFKRVWDTTVYKPNGQWFRSDTVQNMPFIGNKSIIGFLAREVTHQLGYISDSIANIPIFKKLIYQKIKSTYSGLFRERLLRYFLEEEVIQEGFAPYNWFMKSILDDYYSVSEFPAYSAWVKEYEQSKADRYKGITSVGKVPLFTLLDIKRNLYKLNDTKDKFTIVNFWYSGCVPCKENTVKLNQLLQRYKKDTNVVFLQVSVDKDKTQWEKSIKEGMYVPKGGIQLWTGGQGKEHEMLEDFYVKDFPTIRMYDKNGKITVDAKEPLATILSAEQLITVISGNQMMSFQDGPYVFFKDGKPKAFSVKNNKVSTQKVNNLSSATDLEDKALSILLQKEIAIPASVHPAVSSMIVLSDIEGNFTPFRKLLQNNKVMDDNFNWTFGDGHLVFAGDMFDRGQQVTECLWLIYSLEEKAKAAGGMVHFILGNHEIMNLQGDVRYVHDKYKKSAELLGKKLTDLYNENSELGRWLRTKNIVEKIGDMLFMHGGVSAELNSSGLTIEQINQLARPNYDLRKKDYGDAKVNTVMSSSVGPFWFRGYYQGKPAEDLVDSTIQKFGVNRIITGHTIVADTISVHYGGKVINTDTKHAIGKSEALLIEGNKFYRVNGEGKRVLLFIDDKKKKSTTTVKNN